MALQTIIKTKTVRVGVTALARETGLSQPYVSKLLARGFPPDAIRRHAVFTRPTREMQARARALREITEHR
jgi:hypothetical protein